MQDSGNPSSGDDLLLFLRPGRIRKALAGTYQGLLARPVNFIIFMAWIGALAVRIIDLSEVPLGFFTDEASYGYNAYRILTSGKDEHGRTLPLFFEAFGEYKLPLFIYLEIPFIALLGLNEFSVRFVAALVGSLTVPAVYLLGKELFRREIPAVAGALLLAILPWHFLMTRTGFGEVALFPLLTTVALYLFLRAARKEASFFPAALVFGVAFYSYRSAWVTIPPMLVVLAILYRSELWAARRSVFLGLGALGLMLLPIAYHLVLGSGDRSSQASIFQVDDGTGLAERFWQYYTSYFDFSFLFETGPIDPVLRHFLPGHGMLYPFMLPFIIAGVVGLIIGVNRRGFFLLVMLGLFPLAGALSNFSPITTRTIFGSVVFCLVTAAGIGYVTNFFLLLPKNVSRPFIGTTLVLVLILGGASFVRFQDRYFGEYPTLASGYWGWQDGAEEILHLFEERQSEYDDLWLDGHFNAPTVFIPFYLGDSCPKCRIGGFDRFNIDRKQLFAFRSENEDLAKWNYVVKDTLYYPDGKPSFYILELVGKR
jgi:4-amino-4-deoxy-L-arabinose transferase-like glycosyltransferase